VSEAAAIAALQPFHIWQEAFVVERLKWKPKSPLSLLLLRVYRRSEPALIPYRSEYGGCRSWIELQTELSMDAAQPVLSQSEYDRIVGEIQAIG
jgi:hypothetical protein